MQEDTYHKAHSPNSYCGKKGASPASGFAQVSRVCVRSPRKAALPLRVCRAEGTNQARLRAPSHAHMAAIGPPPAALPLAPLPAPAVPHLFSRCTPVGAEPEWDYLRVSTACAVYQAFPLLGWIDVSAAFPGHAAAPALSLLRVLGPPMHFDWGTPAADAALRLSELVASIDLAAYARLRTRKRAWACSARSTPRPRPIWTFWRWRYHVAQCRRPS